MAIFTTLVKFYFNEYFYNTKVAGLGKILSNEIFWLCSISQVASDICMITCSYKLLKK